MSTIVSGGLFKGRKLEGPEGELTRPTSNKIRQALFSIIGQNLSGMHFYDVYAGAGSVGLEALSRGAEQAVFVEKSPTALKALRANIALLSASDRADVHQEQAEVFLDSVESFPQNTILFLDPPFQPVFPDLTDLLRPFIGQVEIIVQCPKGTIDSWVQSSYKTKSYGISSLIFL